MAAGNVETSQRITDVILGALAKAAAGPDSGGEFGDDEQPELRRMGHAARTGHSRITKPLRAAWGLRREGHGRSATHTHMTNSWNTPIEAFEHEYPVRVRGYRVRGGSGGAGKHAGGDGIVRELEFLESADVTILSDRHKRGPYGLQGGGDGAPGRCAVGGKELPSKIRFAIAPGETLRIETPGGGGRGDSQLDAQTRLSFSISAVQQRS